MSRPVYSVVARQVKGLRGFLRADIRTRVPCILWLLSPWVCEFGISVIKCQIPLAWLSQTVDVGAGMNSYRGYTAIADLKRRAVQGRSLSRHVLQCRENSIFPSPRSTVSTLKAMQQCNDLAKGHYNSFSLEHALLIARLALCLVPEIKNYSDVTLWQGWHLRLGRFSHRDQGAFLQMNETVIKDLWDRFLRPLYITSVIIGRIKGWQVFSDFIPLIVDLL